MTESIKYLIFFAGMGLAIATILITVEEFIGIYNFKKEGTVKK